MKIATFNVNGVRGRRTGQPHRFAMQRHDVKTQSQGDPTRAISIRFSGIPERKVCAADRVGSRFEGPRRLGVLAGKSLIDRSNGRTFVIGNVQQRPTRIHLGNVGLQPLTKGRTLRLGAAAIFFRGSSRGVQIAAIRDGEIGSLI
jgi:hypothetical protein